MDDDDERGWLWKWISWKPTSRSKLKSAETRVLSHLTTEYRGEYVPVGNDNHLWTIRTAAGGAAAARAAGAGQQRHPQQEDRVPLVLVHGFASGVALWVRNLDALSRHRPVHAFDMLGFARSSRPTFSADPMEAEREFVDAIDAWFRRSGLGKCILLGHSFGAFVAAAFALRHPEHVHHLVLVDAWGFEEGPPPARQTTLPLWIRMLAKLLTPFNPLASVRAAGPMGRRMIQKFRPDLGDKFHGLDRDSIYDYIYHCNAQAPSGETALKTLTKSFGWAKFPMINRVELIDKNIPITFVYGSRSWINSNTGHMAQAIRHGSPVNVEIIKGAGHHVYTDRATEFNALVNQICNAADPPTASLPENDVQNGSLTHSTDI